MTNHTNYSVLPFYTDIKYQNHLRQQRTGYGNGEVWPLVSELKKCPPFQIIRTETPGAILTVNLVRVSDGTTTDITTDITANGLQVQAFAPDYDIIVYPATLDMDNLPNSIGHHYLIITDGTNSWWSEIFNVVNSVSTFIKVSFWHDERFNIPGGHISYVEPFSNFFYLPGPITRPVYPLEEEIDERDQYEFLLHGASSKAFRWRSLVPEFMADIIRLLPLHYHRLVEFDGITFDGFTLKIEFKDWVQGDHLVPIEFSLTPDTQVQTTGKLIPDGDGFEYDQTEYDTDEHD